MNLPEVVLTQADVEELFAAAVARGDHDRAAALASVLLVVNDSGAGQVTE